MSNLNQLITLITKVLSIHQELTEHTVLEQIENWDSLSALRVMNAIEKEFSIKLPLYKFLKAITIADLLQLIGDK